MALHHEIDIESWVDAVQTCQPEDIVDIADQLGLIQNAEQRAAIADRLGPIVVGRELPDQLTEHWIYTTGRYVSDVPYRETIEVFGATE